MNWLLTDMDSFFASAEKHLTPSLRDRPVGVIPLQSEHTCVIAASRDAKKLGVKVGTKVGEAKRLCPGIALVKARPATYVKIHERILEIVDRFAPVESVDSIDEWGIRLTGPQRDPATAADLARGMKEALRADFSRWLTCSIGIAETKLLAKIASEMGKPNGLTVLPTADIPARLGHLPPKALCGIGGGMSGRLARAGVRTVRDLWDMERAEAERIWGSIDGARWWDWFHGIDAPPPKQRRRSMTHAKILEPELRNRAGARGVLERLIYRLGRRLVKEGYVARRLRMTLLSQDGSWYGDEAGLPGTDDTPTLLEQFAVLWRRGERVMPRRIKRVEVTVSGLESRRQVGLLPFPETEKRRRLSAVVEKINADRERLAVYFGSTHDYRKTALENKIAFGRVPDRTPAEL